jgi:hypothetical protein
MPHDYGIYYRDELSVDADWAALPKWDFFLSGYNLAERIRTAFDRVEALNKVWLLHTEYALSPAEAPNGTTFSSLANDESSHCKELLSFLQSNLGFDPKKHSLCIDITGIIRPHLMFLVRLLQNVGVRKLDTIYAEPLQYSSKENTPFSSGHMLGVRPVHGYEGSPITNATTDFLIVGMGYDDRLLASVAENKEKADKHQLFGLPSLRADMYQESVLRSRRAAEEIGDPNFSEQNRSFAPANDPFGTASVLDEIVRKRITTEPGGNIVLAPLGTKAQVLGFVLYFIYECSALPVSVIFPFSTGYASETSTGLARAWRYQLEL